MGNRIKFLNLVSHAEIKYAVINEGSTGDNTLVSAVAGKKILMISCIIISAGEVGIRFEDGASTGTYLSGIMPLTSNSGFTAPFNEGGWLIGSTNTLLNLELSGTVDIDGMLTYVEV